MAETAGLQFMNQKETAKYIGVSLGTLKKLDIPFTRAGRRVIYTRSLVDSWVLENAGKEVRSEGNNRCDH